MPPRRAAAVPSATKSRKKPVVAQAARKSQSKKRTRDSDRDKEVEKGADENNDAHDDDTSMEANKSELPTRCAKKRTKRAENPVAATTSSANLNADSSVHLHNDALSSILAFLDATDFSFSLTVSRQWYLVAQRKSSWPQTFALADHIPTFHSLDADAMSINGSSLSSRRARIPGERFQHFAQSAVYLNVRDLRIIQPPNAAEDPFAPLAELSSLTALEVCLHEHFTGALAAALESDAIKIRLLGLKCPLFIQQPFPSTTLGALTQLRVLAIRSPLDPTAIMHLHSLEYFEGDDLHPRTSDLAYALRYLSVHQALRHLTLTDYNGQTAAAFSQPVKRSFDGRPIEDLPIARLLTIAFGERSEGVFRTDVLALCEIQNLQRLSLYPMLGHDDDTIGSFLSPESASALKSIASIEWLSLDINNEAHYPGPLSSDLGVGLTRWTALRHLHIRFQDHNECNFARLLPTTGLSQLEELSIEIPKKLVDDQFHFAGYHRLALLTALRRLSLFLPDGKFTTGNLSSLLQSMKTLQHFERLDITVHGSDSELRLTSRLLCDITEMSNFHSLHLHFASKYSPLTNQTWWNRAIDSRERVASSLAFMPRVQQFRIFLDPPSLITSADPEGQPYLPSIYRVDDTSENLKWINCTNECKSSNNTSSSCSSQRPPTTTIIGVVPVAPRLVGIELNPGPRTNSSALVTPDVDMTSSSSVQQQPRKKTKYSARSQSGHGNSSPAVPPQASTVVSIHTLNNDVISLILVFLDARSFAAAMKVAKSWNIASQLKTAWPRECDLYYHMPAIHSGDYNTHSHTYRDLLLREIDGESLRQIGRSSMPRFVKDHFRDLNAVKDYTPKETHIQQLMESRTYCNSTSIRVEGDGLTQEKLMRLATLPQLHALSFKINWTQIDDFGAFFDTNVTKQLRALTLTFQNEYAGCGNRLAQHMDDLTWRIGRLDQLRALTIDHDLSKSTNELQQLHALTYLNAWRQPDITFDLIGTLRLLSVEHSLRQLSLALAHNIYNHPKFVHGFTAASSFIDPTVAVPTKQKLAVAQLISISLPMRITLGEFHSLCEMPTLRRMDVCVRVEEPSRNDGFDLICKQTASFFFPENPIACATLRSLEMLSIYLDVARNLDDEVIETTMRGFGEGLSTTFTQCLKSLSIKLPGTYEIDLRHIFNGLQSNLIGVESLTLATNGGTSGEQLILPDSWCALSTFTSLQHLKLNLTIRSENLIAIAPLFLHTTLPQLRRMDVSMREIISPLHFTLPTYMLTRLNSMPQLISLHLHRLKSPYDKGSDTYRWSIAVSNSELHNVADAILLSPAVARFRVVLSAPQNGQQVVGMYRVHAASREWIECTNEGSNEE